MEKIPGLKGRKPTPSEYRHLKWVMRERDIDEIVADRKKIVDYLTKKRDSEGMCWLLFRQCRFARDELVRGVMSAVGGPGGVFSLRGTSEGFILEGL